MKYLRDFIVAGICLLAIHACFNAAHAGLTCKIIRTPVYQNGGIIDWIISSECKTEPSPSPSPSWTPTNFTR